MSVLTKSYSARLVTALPVWEIGSMRLKPYWIDREDEVEPPPELLKAAWKRTADVLPDAAETEGDSLGLGFVLLHRGAGQVWLMMDWWAHGDICCQRVARAERGSNAFKLLPDRPLMACVWEMAVIWREREAWVSTMMTNRPNPSAYLKQRVTDGWY